MARVKFSSEGPNLIVIDSKTKPEHLLISNPSVVMTVALQVQVYGESGFHVRPNLALIPKRATADIELLGDKAGLQSFHIVATHWPYGNNQYDKETWKMLERKYKEKFQIVSFGTPPKYAGLKEIAGPAESPGQGQAERPATESSGPKLLDAHLSSISFKPPTGASQTVVFKIKNVCSSKPIAFKVMVNKGPYYTARPGKGIIDISKDAKIQLEMMTSYTKKDYEKDNKGHEVHVMGLKWPKKLEEYHHDEWPRLEKARKDQKQRLVISINHKGLENAPTDGPQKTSEEMSNGPTLLEVIPKKILLTPPLTKSHTLTLKNDTTGAVAFKLQTNRPNFYVVKPCRGIIKAESKMATKIDVNESLNVKDFQDAEGHQLLMFAVEWPHGDEFEPDQFASLMKTKKVVGKLQRQGIGVELEIASKNMYLSSVPQKLSYKPPVAHPQNISVTLVNKSPKPAGFKIETGHPCMDNFFNVTPDKGRIEPSHSTQVNFTLSDKARVADMPADAVSFCFKVNAITWPLPTFNDELWQEYQTFKKGEIQLLRLRVDFEGLDPQVADDGPGMGGQMGTGADQYAEAMMMAMMMQQMQQQQMMQMQGMNPNMMMGMMAPPPPQPQAPADPSMVSDHVSRTFTSQPSSIPGQPGDGLESKKPKSPSKRTRKS